MNIVNSEVQRFLYTLKSLILFVVSNCEKKLMNIFEWNYSFFKKIILFKYIH